jgi:hypothetical protein
MATFPGLHPGEQYRFRVAALNSAGPGKWSPASFSQPTNCARE